MLSWLRRRPMPIVPLWLKMLSATNAVMHRAPIRPGWQRWLPWA